ncbi:MAG TPA: hypothetical protein EYG51_24010 [Pseudomonadales bacterium]|nr:hypothetical protein [Pseudomonadales bacterium]
MNKRALAVIKDILTKYPKGSAGNLLPDHYEEHHDYCEVGEYYKNFVTPKGDGTFGYSEDQILAVALADLGLGVKRRINVSDWEDTVRNLWPEAKKGTVSRRARRLWHRIGKDASRIWRAGKTTGIYRVNFGSRWDDNAGHVYAWGTSSEDAKIVAETMCSHAFCGLKASSSKLWTLEEAPALIRLNNAASRRAEKSIKETKAELIKLAATLESLEARKGVIGGFSALQMCALLDDESLLAE